MTLDANQPPVAATYNAGHTGVFDHCSSRTTGGPVEKRVLALTGNFVSEAYCFILITIGCSSMAQKDPATPKTFRVARLYFASVTNYKDWNRLVCGRPTGVGIWRSATRVISPHIDPVRCVRSQAFEGVGLDRRTCQKRMSDVIDPLKQAEFT